MLPAMYILQYQDAEDTMSLARLAKENFPVTPGFIITKKAQKDFFAENDLTTKIYHLLGSVDESDKKSLQKTSEAIKKLILNGNLSLEFVGEVFRAYGHINGMLHDVAVTLQPTKAYAREPIATHGEANILLHIKSIWASLFTPDRLTLHQKILPTTDIMVKKSPKDAILAEVYTTSENKSTMHINITKQKKTATYAIPKNIPQDYAFPERPLIPLSQLQQLISMANSIERFLYFPQKITMYLEKNTLSILHVLPITPSSQVADEITPNKQTLTTPLQTATKLYVSLSQPQLAVSISKRQTDGIGLLEGNSLIAQLGVHPKKVIHEKQQKKYTRQLAEAIAAICTPFSPRPVVYKLSDFTTNSYKKLDGGNIYEVEESNPLLGYRGAFRYNNEPEVLQLELDAIKTVRNEMGLKNLWLMFPFVRTTTELTQAKKLLTKAGLYRNQNLQLWLSIDLPAQVMLIDKFLTLGIDGISTNLDSLHMLTLGVDNDNTEAAHSFANEHEALFWSLERLTHAAHTYSLPSSAYGRALSPQLLEKLVTLGITSITVCPEALESTREYIAEAEKKLWQK